MPALSRPQHADRQPIWMLMQIVMPNPAGRRRRL
jgi:hypothetical protein